MKLTARELSDRLNGQLIGDPEIVVTHPAKIEEGNKGSVCFIANPKYTRFAITTDASVIIVDKSFELEDEINASLIKVEDPYMSFTNILEWYTKDKEQAGISKFAFIDPSAKIADDVYVGPMAYVGKGCEIGQGSRVYPFVYLGDQVKMGTTSIIYSGVNIYHDCEIGDNCIIHSGTVIGSDGFGFAQQPDGEYKKIPQTGNVVVENNVEIGANCAIDRATVGSTRIMEGVKIDNLVQIAHNVQLGDHTVLAAQVGVSGSTKLGKYNMIGGQAGFVGHLDIADFTKVNAQSGVSKSVTKPDSKLTGSPAADYNATLRAQAVFRRLPELEKRIDELERMLEKYKKENTE